MNLESDLILVVHPIAVHFAVALTCCALILDWVAHWRQRAEWRFAGRLCFFVGVLALGVTVGSGWVEHLFPRPASVFDAQIEGLLFYHEYGGYGVLGFFVTLAVMRARLPEPLPVPWLVCATIGVLGVLGQGYIGGEMVYRYGAGVRAVQVLSERPHEHKKAPEEQSTEAGTSDK